MALRSVFRSFVLGAAAGAAAVWFNDPEKGGQRREQFAEKAQQTIGTASKVADDAREMTGGSGQSSSGRSSSDQSSSGQSSSGQSSSSGDTVDLTTGAPMGTSVGTTDPMYAPRDRPI